MDHLILSNLISEIFLPLGFKKKGVSWVMQGGEITKIIYLQKSSFGERFYINYGFIINSIPLGSLRMHIFKGLGSTDESENKRILDLLDFGKEINPETRLSELKKYFVNKIVSDMQTINTEADLKLTLERKSELYDVPVKVKEYFNMAT